MINTPGPHRVLVDTNIVIDALRGRMPAMEAIDGRLAEHEVLCLSVVSRFEVLAGARPAELDAIREHLSIYVSVGVDDAIADTAGDLARTYRRSHSSIDAVDYLIAASTRLHADELLTLNVKHFPMFPNLEPPYRARA